MVAGHGLIQERNINTGETVEFEVSDVYKRQGVVGVSDWITGEAKKSILKDAAIILSLIHI